MCTSIGARLEAAVHAQDVVQLHYRSGAHLVGFGFCLNVVGFETGPYYVVPAVLELTVQARLRLQS